MNNLFTSLTYVNITDPNLPNFDCNKTLEQGGENQEGKWKSASRFKSLPMKLRFARGWEQTIVV